MEIVSKYLWLVLVVVLIILIVHPNSNASGVIGALANQTVNNTKALQGNAGKGNY